jgi:hypothetical protein
MSRARRRKGIGASHCVGVLRVPPHHDPLLLREGAPLAEDPIRHGDLADVVQECAAVHVGQVGLREPQDAGEVDRHRGHALAVSLDRAVPQVEGPDPTLQRGVVGADEVGVGALQVVAGSSAPSIAMAAWPASTSRKADPSGIGRHRRAAEDLEDADHLPPGDEGDRVPMDEAFLREAGASHGRAGPGARRR